MGKRNEGGKKLQRSIQGYTGNGHTIVQNVLKMSSYDWLTRS